MSRKSVFTNAKLLLAGGLLALAISSGAATASPLDGISVTIETGLSCPIGTHAGYEDKYCWPNRGRACPVGYHPGYEGKYCWRD